LEFGFIKARGRRAPIGLPSRSVQFVGQIAPISIFLKNCTDNLGVLT